MVIFNVIYTEPLACDAVGDLGGTYAELSWDAECVAKILLNKLDLLPDANPQDIYWTIGQLVVRRSAMVKVGIALKNQLHQQLSYHYPSYQRFFSDIDGKCSLAFWEQYPSPHKLEGVTVEELAIFLQKASNNAFSTRKAANILALVETDGDTKRQHQDQRDFLIQSHVRDLKFKKQEMAAVEAELARMMKLLDYQLETMPGIDTVTAA